MVDLIVYEEEESKHLIVVNNRIIVHRTLYKKGQCIKISYIENCLDKSPVNVKNYITNDILIVNHIELNNDVETCDNIKSIFISSNDEGFISNKKDIILPIDYNNNNNNNNNNNKIEFKLIPRNSFITMMYNIKWYKILSQTRIDDLLKKHHHDTSMCHFNFVVNSSDDDNDRINSEIINRNEYNNKKMIYNISRRVCNMNAEDVEAVCMYT